MVAVHDFQHDLEFSEAASEEPFWRAIYDKAFPDLVSQALCSGKTTSQRLGIDRIIHLSSGKTLNIQEKKRRPKTDGTEYDDIFLEFLSNDRTNAPGWIEKDLQIDYLAYAFIKSKRVYLFPWEMLRRAWKQFGWQWILKYGKLPAQNNGYVTYGVAVPIPVLRQAVSSASIIQL